jgi:carboxyl-terminal processing protease
LIKGLALMSSKLKVAGWVALGAVAGALTTMQLQANARSGLSPLPLDEMQQLAAVFGLVKAEYVEQVDEKKLINDAIGGMVSGLDPHSQFFDKKTFKEFRKAPAASSSVSASRSAWKTAWSRSSRPSKARRPSAPA